MTDIKPQMMERARKTPPPRRRRKWIWALIASAMVVGAVLAIALLWPEGDEVALPETVTPSQAADVPAAVLPPPAEDEVAGKDEAVPEGEVAAPATGELTWSQVADAPSNFLAIAASPEGFLAAAPASVGGVDVWTSTDGETWELLVSDQTAFAADEVVGQLRRGPSGFVAVATRLPERIGPDFSPTTARTSPDGATWHRAELTAGLEDPGTPYLQHWFEVTKTVSGSDGFVAIGTSKLLFDPEAILADFAPEASTAHYMFGEGPTTIEISTEDGTELVLTYAELGITPEQRDAARLDSPSLRLWWSGDGISWAAIDLTETRAQLADVPGSPEEASLAENLVGAEDGFYLFAGPRLGFRSTDGRRWTSFEMHGLPEEFHYGVTAVEGGFILFGREEAHGYFGSGPGEPSLWTSPDGRNWTRGNLDVPFEVSEAIGGPLGILVHGGAVQVVERVESVELVKDGYVVTMGIDSWTLADEATGELIGETGHGIEIGDSSPPGTFPIVDSATGEELLVITEDEIVAAEQAVIESVDTGAPEVDMPPTELLAFSTDGTTWKADEVTELFGDYASIFRVAVGVDRAIALIPTDFDALMWYAVGEGESEPPPIEVWVGKPGG